MPADPLQTRSPAEQVVFAVAGGNHVTIELDREVTDGSLDVIEVLAQPGGGPPPHSHAFGEWFLIREGVLTLCEEREGVVVCTREIAAGESVWVPPWTVHGTLNLSRSPVRFQVVGQPGLMSAYFAEAGVPVADDRSRPATDPAGPDALTEIAERWGIRFWTGPVDRTPL
ncbi:MAG: cupin domain-containing protein [Solirubrobacterales bacterium]